MDLESIPAEVRALRDLASAMERSRPQLGSWRMGRPGISFLGPDPSADPGEREIARLGCTLRLFASYADLGLGERVLAAGTLLVTDRRLVLTFVEGKSAAGPFSRSEAIGGLNVPWLAVQEISRPQKVSIGERLAGGSAVKISNYTTAVFALQVQPASALSPPPGSSPTRKIKAEEAQLILCRAAATSLLPTASPTDRPFIEAAAEGRYTAEDGELCGFFTNPAG